MSSPDTPAPGPLEVVREFVNTLDIEDGTDDLETPRELASWLQERGLLRSGAELGQRELRRAIELREALRQLLLANNGAPLGPEEIETLNEAVSDATLSVHFDGEGRPALRGAAPDAPMAPLVAIVYEAMVSGNWARLKACPADDCHWAFYDHSKNRSGTWCEMSVCGNRAKARAYRERHAGHAPASPGRAAGRA